MRTLQAFGWKWKIIPFLRLIASVVDLAVKISTYLFFQI